MVKSRLLPVALSEIMCTIYCSFTSTGVETIKSVASIQLMENDFPLRLLVYRFTNLIGKKVIGLKGNLIFILLKIVVILYYFNH